MWVALLAGLALAEPTMPWERDVRGVELLVMQPVLHRVLGLQKKPDVRWPAPVEGAIGHIALRLVDNGPAADQWAVSISAYMDIDGDGEDDPSSACKGIFGGYDLRLAVVPLQTFAEDYAIDQARWIRRYILPMTRQEIRILLHELERAWTQGEAHELGSYKFFTENCATELTQLLNTAIMGKPREFNYPMSVPKKLKRKGFITPLLATSMPEDIALPFERQWVSVPGLFELCSPHDGPCIDGWTTAMGWAPDVWADELAKRMRRKRYRRRFPEVLRVAVQTRHD